MARRRKNLDFETVMRGMLNEKAKDAGGQDVLIDGKKATYLEVLCKQILQKSFKDANLGWRVLVKAGVLPPDEKMDTSLDSFMQQMKS